MRSRYSAFVTGELDHVEHTHASYMRDDYNRSQAQSVAAEAKWMGLEIRQTTGGGPDDETGTVEFVARFKRGQELTVHHELSNFCREDGNWMYVDGEMSPRPATVHVDKVGRNEPCPCGSGKKYKKCCAA